MAATLDAEADLHSKVRAQVTTMLGLSAVKVTHVKVLQALAPDDENWLEHLMPQNLRADELQRRACAAQVLCAFYP